jgi:DNA-binding CsgD family transcriptional regulator
MNVSTTVFSAIVGEIYEAALEPARWEQVLHLIGKAVSAETGTVWIHDFADSSASFDGAGSNIAAYIGFEDGALESYAAHYSAVNVWTAREEALPPGSAVTSGQLFPNSSLKRTEFYSDWLRKSDLFHALGSVVERNHTRAVKLSFLRSEQAGEFDEAQFRLMQALMPHIRTAVNIHQRMHSVKALADAALVALDALNFGVILLSQSGTFIHWNATAQRIAARTGAFVIGSAGRVQCASSTATQRITAAISQAIAAARGSGNYGGCMLKITGRQEVQIFVAPVGLSGQRFGPGVAAVLFVRDGGLATVDLSSSLRSIYQMTAAEASLAEALTDGKSLKVFADERGVTLNTVKSQMKNVAAKLGVKRQVDVVREILTGPAVLHVRPCQDVDAGGG